MTPRNPRTPPHPDFKDDDEDAADARAAEAEARAAAAATQGAPMTPAELAAERARQGLGAPGPNPTQRMMAQLGRVTPTAGQNDTIERVREAYSKLAADMCRDVPPGAELTVAIRKLVESKDCAIRAILFP